MCVGDIAAWRGPKAGGGAGQEGPACTAGLGGTQPHSGEDRQADGRLPGGAGLGGQPPPLQLSALLQLLDPGGQAAA